MVIAHRGASSYAPENTLASFDLALEMGARHIELDVDLTSDGHVVVIHDDTVDWTTNGSGPVTGHTSTNGGKARKKSTALSRWSCERASFGSLYLEMSLPA